jgi:hypothetical protein
VKKPRLIQIAGISTPELSSVLRICVNIVFYPELITVTNGYTFKFKSYEIIVWITNFNLFTFTFHYKKLKNARATGVPRINVSKSLTIDCSVSLMSKTGIFKDSDIASANLRVLPVIEKYRTQAFTISNRENEEYVRFP